MKKLTAHEELISTTINDAINEAQPEDIVNFLIDNKFINIKVVERIAILKNIAELEKGGMPKCRAMDEVSYKFCCSYEKVRGIMYNGK